MSDVIFTFIKNKLNKPLKNSFTDHKICINTNKVINNMCELLLKYKGRSLLIFLDYLELAYIATRQ